MRNAFAKELERLAESDPRVVFLSGDIGNRIFDSLKSRFPDRFYNCGVAEANMTGVAAGLAMSGLRPITYTITPFATTRCLEQIRDDICYHRLPVVVVGVGAGLSYAGLGPTHHSCEDIAWMRMLPGMTVVCPGDPVEARLALRAAAARNGPVYLRLGKKGEPVVHAVEPAFEIGRGIVLAEGDSVCLISTGNILAVARDAAAILEVKGHSTQLVSFHTVKPLDEFLLAAAFARFDLVVTLEEHSVLGGLGGALAEWVADHVSPKARLLRIGAPDAFFHESGNQSFARERLGLTADQVARRIEETMSRLGDEAMTQTLIS